MKFSEMKIDHDIVRRLEEHGIITPTQVQEKSIPPALEGRDVLVESETGSGKTIAFGVPIWEHVHHGKGIQAIILCPTRELAKQVAGEFEKFGKGLEILTIYGGVGFEPQIEGVKTADIVVGTPGRVLDLLERGAFTLAKVKFLVLDEADRMLDMGFVDDIERVVKQAPKDRQTFLFSATVTYRIETLSEKYMRSPLLIRVKSHLVRGHLFQGYYVIHPWQKIGLLARLIEHQDKALVFCRTIVATDHVAAELRKRGIKAEALNGDLSQARREQVVKEFTEDEFSVLVATDVAARGLHIDDISHVYNYDVPDEPETYVHRVGRTARQGRDGDAITFLSEDDYRKFDPIIAIYEDELHKLDYAQWGKVERIAPSPPRGPRRDGEGGGRGGPHAHAGPRRGGPRRGGRSSRQH